MIGIFDSGSGGLTVLHAIRERMPSCDVVYFGDIVHAPYGSKSRAELSRYTVGALQFLQERGCERIVSACNTVSASLAVSLFDTFSIAPTDLIEMVGPTVSYFRDTQARMLLCATPATIESGIYQDAFRMVGKEITVCAMPGLAGAIEFAEPDETIRAYIMSPLESIDLAQYDVLILACTHYPLAAQIFRELVPHSVELFDPAMAVAARVEKQFWPREVGEGRTTFYTSQDTAPFRALVARLFPHTAYSIEIV